LEQLKEQMPPPTVEVNAKGKHGDAHDTRVSGTFTATNFMIKTEAL
jgi:hypothetical protein